MDGHFRMVVFIVLTVLEVGQEMSKRRYFRDKTAPRQSITLLFAAREALLYSVGLESVTKNVPGKAHTAAIPRGIARICNAAGRIFSWASPPT
jgi:hypothetical protein